jgi:hypothetical protein
MNFQFTIFGYDVSLNLLVFNSSHSLFLFDVFNDRYLSEFNIGATLSILKFNTHLNISRY